MAEDDKKKDQDDDDSSEFGDDFGALTGGDESSLGNLPPLSDFDSTDAVSEGNLPPLGSLSSGDDDLEDVSEGLPTPDDVRLDTPGPDKEKGKQEASVPSFGETPAFDTPDADLDTPEPSGGFGFQDLAADSDFSPETPEIGPGPDSDIETPMFDSAFGGDSGDFGSGNDFGGGQGTPAPTQAMETPMFEAGEDSGGDFGFDNDAFGGSGGSGGGMGSGGDDIGTPIPDFSPDTGVPPQSAGPATPAAPKRKARSPIQSALVGGGLVVLGLIIGVVAGPFADSFLSFMPNPVRSELEEAQQTIEQQEQTIARMRGAVERGSDAITPEQLDALIAEFEKVQQDKAQAENELAAITDELQDKQNQYALVLKDIEDKSAQFVEAQDQYDQLLNLMAITEARHEGLLAENDRLTDMVGQLEEANARRQATKDALVHGLALLDTHLTSSIPLTPADQSHASRVARAEALRSEALGARWVDPALMQEYTDLYLE